MAPSETISRLLLCLTMVTSTNRQAYPTDMGSVPHEALIRIHPALRLVIPMHHHVPVTEQ